MTAVFSEAIETTLRTLEQRARLYRNTVVAVVIVALTSVALAIAMRRWSALSCLALVAPVAGVFLMLDARKTSRWRARIIEMWRTRGLDRRLFEQTITSMRQLPPRSMRGMLETLPLELAEVERIEAVNRKQQRRMALATAMISAAAACIAVGASMGTPPVLVCGTMLMIAALGLKRL